MDMKGIRESFRFGRADIIRIAVFFAVALVEFILILPRYSEASWGIVMFFLLIIPSFKVPGKFRFVLDIILPLYAALFIMYYFQLGCLYGHAMTNELFSFWGYLLIQNRVFYEAVFVFVVYYLFRLFFMSPKVAVIATPVPFMLIAIINYYVYQFRGHELVFLDFTSVNTATKVMGSYSYDLIVPAVFMVIPYVLFIMPFVHMKVEKSRIHIAIREVIFAVLVALTSFISVLSVKGWFADGNHIFREWGDMMSVANGYYMSFAESVRSVIITPPEGYSADTLNSLLAPYESEYPSVLTSDKDTANIIVIMNESYSDLSIYQDKTGKTENPDPYWDSLKENTIRGYAMSSVFGGNTANTEFEFLTGLSMANLPSSSIAYHSFIKDNMYSVTRALADAGYDTFVMHPYFADGWNRPAVYPRLGFGKMFFIDDFSYTQDDIVCGKVKDSCAYENMMRILDEHDKTSEKKTFTYLITIQNHGGYYFDEYTPDVYTDKFDDYTNRCFNTFMSLTRESDKALEMLLTELKTRDEKYVVLVFGDHQPELGLTDPADFMPGGRAWVVPYIIWTNYELTEEEKAAVRSPSQFTSINYLANDVLKAAGFKLNAYYGAIESVRAELPFINSAGFMTSDGTVHLATDELTGKPGDTLKFYRYLQYNIVSDGNNSSLFENYVYN